MSWRLTSDAGTLEWSLALGALAAFAALWPGIRTLPGFLRGLRAAAALLLIGALLRPEVERLELRLNRPRLAVLLDAGPSMAASDDWGKSRLARAAAWLRSHRARIEERAEVALFSSVDGGRRLAFDDLPALRTSPALLDPAAAFPALAGSGAPAARVWLISDGAFGAGEAAGGPSARLGAPVDTLGVGPKKTPRGVGIGLAKSPDFVFLHGRFPIAASFEASEMAGGRLTARLWKGERKIAEADFPVERPFEVFFATFTAEADGLGSQTYRLEAVGRPPGREAASAASREVRVEVIRQKYRIMYLAGRPSFEYTHLRSLLKEDPNHELVSFVILRNPENVSPVPDSELSLIPFPASEIFVSSLFQFDLFILENFAYWRFNLPPSYLQNLRSFVSQGGALLVLGGSNAFTKGGYQGTPLEETFPVSLLGSGDDFSPGLFTPEAVSPTHPLLNLGESPEATAELWRSLPPLEAFSRFASVKPGATVLLRHPSEKTVSGERLPIVAVREYGRGKVMLVGTDSTWRWKLGGGKNWKISSFYARFWRRAVEYLTGSLELKKVKFSPLPEHMPPREPAVLNLRVFDEHFRPVPGSELDVRLLWTGPDGRQRKVGSFEREPGVFQIELTDLAVGGHRVRAVVRYRDQPWGEDSADFLWEAPRGEAPLDRKGLKALSDQTGGRYWDLDRAELEALLETLPPARPQRSVLSRDPVWSRQGWLWALFLALAAEWALRRRRGYL